MLFFYEKMITKKGYKQLVFILMGISVIFALNLVCAETLFSQIKPIYNLGEEFSSEIKFSESEIGYMDINLVCNSITQNLYRGVPEAKTIILKRKLIPAYIENSSGDCHLESVYGSDITRSQNFKISREIVTQLETAQKEYMAGTQIKIKGASTKESGGLVGQIQQGFIEVNLNNLQATDIVRNGEFNLNLSIPENYKKGAYIVLIKVFEKDTQGNILSSQEINYNINVLQKPGKVDIAIDLTSLTPGENLSLIPFLYDKAGEEMEASLLLQIKDSQGGIIYQGVNDANKQFVFETKTNTFAGTASIVAQKDNLSTQKLIEVKQLRKISAVIKNETLYLTNIGNVPYSQIVEIKIGNETVFKEVSVNTNETRVYDLSAPDGAYEVQIRDEDNTIFNQGGISITGKAISVEEARTRVNNFINQYPIVWIFILIVVLGFLIATFMKHRKTMFLMPMHENKKLRSFREEKGFTLIMPQKQNSDREQVNYSRQERQEKYTPVSKPQKPAQRLTTVVEKDIKTNKNVEKIKLQGEIREAEQAGVLHGTKQRCSVIAIKFKNQVPSQMGKENLMQALESAYKQRGTTYFSGDYCLVIFAPTLTRTYKNEETAIKVAQELEKELHSHNRLFKEKVQFGIGVNSGELIVKQDNNLLKFATIEKTIPLAKRIAEISGGEVLLSKDIHAKTMNTVKADKNQTPGIALETFKIKRIVDQNAAEKFIKEFMRRN